MAGNGVVTKVAEKPKVKLALTEAERTRLKALKAKGEAKLTESEKKELGALRKKIVEAAVKASEGGKGYAKPPKVGVGYGKASEDEEEGEDEEESETAAEAEDEDEEESEGHAAESEDEDEDEQESEDSASESEDEEESEGGKGYAKPPKVSLAEAIEGMKSKLEAYLGEDEDEDEEESEDSASESEDEDEDEQESEGFKMGEHDPSEPGPGPAPKKKMAPKDPADAGADQGDPADGGDGADAGDPTAGPEDASDPMAVLKDIYKDLMNLAQLLSGGDGADGGQDGGDMPQDEGEDEGMGKSSPAMRYACASCGETNEVLPPKGFGLMRQQESQKTQPKGKSALREAVGRLEQRLAKKESRFMETNKKVKTLIQENAALRGKLAARSRADKAAKMLREARVPADILSAKDLIEFEPGQWNAQIKMAKRVMGQESNGKTGATPRTGGGLKQTKTVESGAKVAIAAFEAAVDRD